MEWQTVITSIFVLDSGIVALACILAVLFTYIIYLHFETGIYTTFTILAALVLSGLAGHVMFTLSNIFFSHDPARNAIIGATIAMAICTVISVLILKTTADTVYSRYDNKKRPSDASKGAR